MLNVRPLNGETWRDALARSAEYLGFAWEALERYAMYITHGRSPMSAVRMVEHDFNGQGLAIV